MSEPLHTISLADIEKQATEESSSGYTKYSALEAKLRETFEKHKEAKQKSGVQQELVDSLFAFFAKYPQAVLDKLTASGMSKIHFGLVGEKCVDALSWFSDIFLGEMGKPWRLEPTPVPKVPPDIGQLAMSSGLQAAQQYMENLDREPEPTDEAKLLPLVRESVLNTVQVEARRRVKEMERKIADQLKEGDWDDSFEDFLFDCVVAKAAILKGPVERERQIRVWERAGKTKITYKTKTIPTFSRVSPFDAFPGASAVDFTGDFIERTRYTITDLYWMKDQKHYINEKVQTVINQFTSLAGGNVETSDHDEATVLQNQTGDDKVEGTVEGFEFWLTLTGDALRDKGWEAFPSKKKIEAGKLYHVEIHTAAGHIILFDENKRPKGNKPYQHIGWIKIPGSFWYRSLPEVLNDLADACNAATRSIVNNMGLSSGFQIIVPDTQRVIPGTKLTTIFPHKVWQFRNPTNSQMPPVMFEQPQSNANELLTVLNQFRDMADVRSGVPKYLLGGEPPPGVGRTASGISMLLNSAAKGIRRVVVAVDRRVVRPALKQVYDYNLDNEEDFGLLGDADVIASGSVETLMRAELADRRIGLLDAISNSEDRHLIGVRARSELWREAFRNAEMDMGSIVDSVEIAEQKEEMIAANEKRTAEANAAAVEAEAQTAQIKAQTAQVEAQTAQQKAQMEGEIMRLKLQAQIAENQQRAAITRRMASNADLKTAKDLGDIGIPTEEEVEDATIRGDTGATAPLGAGPAEFGGAGPGPGDEGSPI